MPLRSVAGVILAGGRSSRMNGRDKVFTTLAGRPLIRHVIDRIGPQVDALVLSVETTSSTFETFDLLQLPDPTPGHHGPLGGLLAALRHYAGSHEWVLVAPCDAPFVPSDLAMKLHQRALEANASCAVVIYDDEQQPTFSIWNQGVLPNLERAVGQQGLSGIKQFMRRSSAVGCPWPVCDPPPFFNVNDAAALDQANRWIRYGERIQQTCSA